MFLLHFTVIFCMDSCRVLSSDKKSYFIRNMANIISENLVCSRKQTVDFHGHTSLTIPFCHYSLRCLFWCLLLTKENSYRKKIFNIKVKIAEFVYFVYDFF